MARPIPRRLLIHSIVYKPAASPDGWHVNTVTGVTISHVRIDPSSQLVTNKEGLQITLKSMLFYDARGSEPAGVSFTEGDAITFDGQEYRIITVDLIYDEHRLHHWEVGLT